MSDLAYIVLAALLIAATAGLGLLCDHLMGEEKKS
jgi:hypothetical protein